MKTARITPAQIDWRRQDTAEDPPRPDDADPWDEATQLFIRGNDLPERWHRKTQFVILETGFGLGHRFLATWAAWLTDPGRCSRLCFISVEAHPPSAQDLRRAHEASPRQALVGPLCDAWPGPIPGIHVLSFEADRLQLLLAWGEPDAVLPEVTATVDTFFLGGLAPDKNHEIALSRLVKHCARLGAADATATSLMAGDEVRKALQAAGYAVQSKAGGRSADPTLSAQRLPGAHQGPKAQAPHGRRRAPQCRTALVIGAGLAGATAARALAAQGVLVTVLERSDNAASGASGNVAGLFHGIVHPADGLHARVLRAAALLAQIDYTPLFAEGRVTGACGGLLRGVRADAGAEASPASASHAAALAAMTSLLASQGLPPSYVIALDSSAASRLADVDLTGAWCFFPGGGWLAPRELVGAWLAEPGIETRLKCDVAALGPRPQGGWRALDGYGQSLAEADVAVVAGAADSIRLLGPWTDANAWPLQARRGQITQINGPQMEALGLASPELPVASAGYALRLPAALGGGMVCGATSQLDDRCATLRPEDHRANLAQTLRWRSMHEGGDSLTPHRDFLERHATGRVGWRQVSEDRMPVVGPVAALETDLRKVRNLEQARHVPRVTGLYTLCALGSRGITVAPLLGRVLAAWITGVPQPLESDLLDAMDPARFLSRRVRMLKK